MSPSVNAPPAPFSREPRVRMSRFSRADVAFFGRHRLSTGGRQADGRRTKRRRPTPRAAQMRRGRSFLLATARAGAPNKKWTKGVKRQSKTRNEVSGTIYVKLRVKVNCARRRRRRITLSGYNRDRRRPVSGRDRKEARLLMIPRISMEQHRPTTHHHPAATTPRAEPLSDVASTRGELRDRTMDD